MLGIETDSVVGVRVSVVEAEGCSFLLHPAIKRQAVVKDNIVFFIRNRFLVFVNKKYPSNAPGRPVPSMVFASRTKLASQVLTIVQKPVVLVQDLVSGHFCFIYIHYIRCTGIYTL